MATKPLPARTAANDALIQSTPDNLLTARQRAYADLYHLPTAHNVDIPAAPTSGAAPATSLPTASTDATDAERMREAFEQTQIDAAKAKADADKLSGQHDALGLLSQTFAQYGLPPETADWAWSEIKAGKSMNEVTLDLYNPKTVGGQILHQYFPEIQDRQQAGLSPLSPGDIVTYRNEGRQMMSAAGLPKDFYDSNDDFRKFIAGNVSLKELGDRVTEARDATYTMTPAEQARMYHEFGVQPGSGALTAFFFDPDRALPVLQRDFNAARIGGAADVAGYAGISDDTARQLATAGITGPQAQQGFGGLVHQRELFTGLPGQNEQDISQQVQIGAQFLGNAEDQQQIERRARTRVAEFQGGGGFETSREGVGGLGSAR